jgi:hypothetical protein
MRFIEKPHIIKINHPDIPKWEWRDRDTRMLYGAFQVMVDFVELEYGGVEKVIERINDDYEGAEINRHFYQELFSLYIWWTQIRPLQDAWATPFTGDREKNGPGILDFTPEYREHLQTCSELEEKYHQEDEDMFIRLVKIRRCLWT